MKGVHDFKEGAPTRTNGARSLTNSQIYRIAIPSHCVGDPSIVHMKLFFCVFGFLGVFSKNLLAGLLILLVAAAVAVTVVIIAIAAVIAAVAVVLALVMVVVNVVRLSWS